VLPSHARGNRRKRGTIDAYVRRMRVVIFSTHPEERLSAWCEAISRVASVTDILTIGPGDGNFMTCMKRGSMTHCGELLARVRGWQADIGVALGIAQLPPLLHTIPRMGTLNVRLGAGAQGTPPGMHEMFMGAAEVRAAVHWLGVDRRGLGAEGRIPLYRDDSVEVVRERLDELGRLLLTDAVARVAAGGAPGIASLHPPEPLRPLTSMERAQVRMAAGWRRIRRRLRPLSAVKLTVVSAWLAIIRPLRDAVRTLGGRHPVRIFTLHRVTRLVRDGMTVTPEKFRRQMEYVRRRHQIVSLNDAIDLVAKGTRLRRPVAAITFDDGYETVSSIAAPVMRSMGMVGACFVCPEVVQADGRFAHDYESPVKEWMTVMDWRAIQELHEAGWHIGSHTSTHRRLATLAGDDLLRELWEPRAEIRTRVTPAPVAFAYPFGGERDITRDAMELARKCGYLSVLSDYGGENRPGQSDAFNLRRIDIGGGHDDVMWKAMVHGFDLGFWRRLRSRL
jgi:peptidoglycan/xylan/chitin deacetylase (PgdA/CDA1 family)